MQGSGGEKSSKQKLRICIFAYGGVVPATFTCVVSESHYAKERGIDATLINNANTALICKSRSRSLTDFWDCDKEPVMVMIDHDMQWVRGDVCKLAALAQQEDTVVGAIYSKRGMGKGLTACDGENERSFSLNITNGHVAEKCERMGTGMLAIPASVPRRIYEALDADGPIWRAKMEEAMEKRDVDEAIRLVMLSVVRTESPTGPERVIDFFRTIRNRTSKGAYSYLGEDFSFSIRCQYAGIMPHIDLGMMPVHWGEHGFTIFDGVGATKNGVKK